MSDPFSLRIRAGFSVLSLFGKKSDILISDDKKISSRMPCPQEMLSQQNQNASRECLDSIKNVDRKQVGSIQDSYPAREAVPYGEWERWQWWDGEGCWPQKLLSPAWSSSSHGAEQVSLWSAPPAWEGDTRNTKYNNLPLLSDFTQKPVLLGSVVELLRQT